MDNERFDQYIKFIRENPLADEAAVESSITSKIAQREKMLTVVDQIMSLVDTLYDESDGDYCAPIGELEKQLKIRRQKFQGKNNHSDLNWFWYRYCNLEFRMLIDAGYTAKEAKLEIVQDPDFIRNWKRVTGRKTAPSQRILNDRLQLKKLDKEFDLA